MSSIPDLLYPKARIRIRGRALKEALTFAFAAGSGDALARILAQTKLGPSEFKSSCFSADLFLEDFVRECLIPEVGGERRGPVLGYLVNLLSQPPDSLAVVEFRHAVFRELDQPGGREALDRAWLAIDRLRAQLESPGLAQRVHPIHRRLDILRSFRDAIQQLAQDFTENTSGLGRIGDFARGVLASSGWEDLCQLLDHEEHLATVQVSVRVAYDGQIRGFEIVRATENRKNPLYQPPGRRLLGHLWGLLRGYRLKEREVLGRLVEHVFDGVEDAMVLCFQLLCDLEFYLSGLSLRDAAQARGLSVSLPDFLPSPSAAPGGSTSIEGLFNPFLLREPRPPVPCDVQADRDALVVVTGPNSGGKTRLLQAIGLAQLTAQVGLYVPAARSRLLWTNGLFVSLVQESSSDQREGRLGTELIRIRRMFEELSCNSLVILDELCSGTNPSEGEEIFELVVQLLAELQPQAFITTHFLQFASRLEQTAFLPNLRFLQAQLDKHQHPTYQFVPGVAATSLARQTAERLGVTRDALEVLIAERRAARAQREACPPSSPPRLETRAVHAAAARR